MMHHWKALMLCFKNLQKKSKFAKVYFLLQTLVFSKNVYKRKNVQKAKNYQNSDNRKLSEDSGSWNKSPALHLKRGLWIFRKS